MAEVYLGRQVGPVGFEKTVAIKRLHPRLAERQDLVRMFLSEARVAARLSHPNIGQIYELGHDEDEYFIAMEYIHGRRLADVQQDTERRGARVPFGLVAHIIACLCRALHHAHTLRDELGNLFGLVHGDVSPESVLLAFNGDVKLTDFGVAKATTLAAETQTGILKGKFGYMSPEQCRNEDTDHRSDIFAAGILLFELTCGQRLFVRDTDFGTVRAVIQGVIPPPSAMVDDVPDELEEIMMTALCRERESRYQSAQEMQLALEAAIRSNGWRTGPLALSRYLTEMFADRMTPSTDHPRVSLGESPPAARDRTSRRARAGQQGNGPVASRAEELPTTEHYEDGTVSGSAPFHSEVSSVPLQDEVPTIDVPHAARMRIEETTDSEDPPFPPLWSNDAAQGNSGQVQATGRASAVLDDAHYDRAATDGVRADLALPDENLEGPTIIQPPDFEDVVLGKGTQEPAADYWDVPQGAGDPVEASDEPAESVESADLADFAFEQPDESFAPESEAPPSTRKWLLWLTAVLLILLVGVGAAIGFLLSKRTPARSGTLVSVTSTPPGATVYVDGIEHPRKTPLVLKHVIPGRRHWLVVTRDGYRTATRRFIANKDERLTLKIPLAQGKTSDTATIEVEVEPTGARIYLDGTRRGVAPARLTSVAAGVKHTLVIRKKGFEDKIVTIAQLRPGSRHVTSVKLRKAKLPQPESEDDDEPVVVPEGETGEDLRRRAE